MTKNPLLSLWMTSMNSAWGYAHGRAMAEARRQNALIIAAGTKQIIRFWSGGALTRPTRKNKA